MDDATNRPPAVPIQRNQRLATLSLMLGIASIPWCLGLLAGIPALIAGMIAMKRAKVTPEKYAGRGLAIAGLVLGCLSLTYPVLLPAFSGAKQKAASINCIVSLRRLAEATIQCANDREGRLPAAESWCDMLQSYVGSADIFHCARGRADQRSHYALNASLSGLDIKRVKNPEQVVLFFEIDGGWNVSGGRAAMLAHPRHRDAYGIAFLDGHSGMVRASRLDQLRWNP